MSTRELDLTRRQHIVNGLMFSFGISRDDAERAADRAIAMETRVVVPPLAAIEALSRTMCDQMEQQSESGRAVLLSVEDAERRSSSITLDAAYGFGEFPKRINAEKIASDAPFRLKRAQMSEDEIGKLEDAIQRDGYKLARALGFEIVHLSQKRASKQTPGVPDSKFYHRARRLTFWWECKMEGGTQSPAQREFQRMAEACGEHYVLGGLGLLRTWLAGRRVCVFGADNAPIPLPIEEQVR